MHTNKLVAIQNRTPQARNAALGASSSGQKGAPTPISGGTGAEPPPAGGQGSKKKKPEANPFRNLGDALERWKANLSVTQEAPPPKEGEDAAAAQVRHPMLYWLVAILAVCTILLGAVFLRGRHTC